MKKVFILIILILASSLFTAAQAKFDLPKGAVVIETQAVDEC